ncbi:MAG: hypothetical protein IKT92_05775 [Bacteroidaceae bacterium]|nr:hypothetical protein [Bacteroidaceae bacterium]
MKHSFLISALSLGMLFTACSDDDKSGVRLSKSQYEVYANSQKTIEGAGLEGLSWTSSDEIVATATENVIYAGKVGTASLMTDAGAQFTVNVTPKYRLHTDVSMLWGCSPEDIKAKYGVPDEFEDDIMSYESSEPGTLLVMYSFEENTLSSVAVLVENMFYSQLLQALEERYVIEVAEEADEMVVFSHQYGKLAEPIIDYMGLTMSFGALLPNSHLIMYAPVLEEEISETMQVSMTKKLGSFSQKVKSVNKTNIQ